MAKAISSTKCTIESLLKEKKGKSCDPLIFCVANVEVEVNYVENDFAKLDDLSRQMKGSTRAVLYFRGPSGTGKTTT